MNTNATQMVVLGVFIFFLVVAVFVFSVLGTSNRQALPKEVVMWGTVPYDTLKKTTDALNLEKPGTITLNYRELSEDEFEATLVDAMADGVAPDLVLIPQTILKKNEKRLSLIGYESLSERDFKNDFIEGGETLLTTAGSYGLPFLVDPMVMYWNRDILANAGVSRPPASWEEVLAISSKLTEQSSDKSIKRSAIAFGEYQNVPYAKNIIATLLLQTGNRIVARDSSNSAVNLSVRDDAINTSVTPAFSFYTQFADPLKPIYSWNRSLPSAESAFASGKLALYFAPASAYDALMAKNPNLNFDVAVMPQPQNAGAKKTFGTVYSVSIVSTSQNKAGAFQYATFLTSPLVVGTAASVSKLPPARRDLLSTLPGTALGDVFYTSALWTRTWLDPDRDRTDQAVKATIDAIIIQNEPIETAARTFGQRIEEILRP